jgi:hypothetical protein
MQKKKIFNYMYHSIFIFPIAISFRGLDFVFGIVIYILLKVILYMNLIILDNILSAEKVKIPIDSKASESTSLKEK